MQPQEVIKMLADTYSEPVIVTVRKGLETPSWIPEALKKGFRNPARIDHFPLLHNLTTAIFKPFRILPNGEMIGSLPVDFSIDELLGDAGGFNVYHDRDSQTSGKQDYAHLPLYNCLANLLSPSRTHDSFIEWINTMKMHGESHQNHNFVNMADNLRMSHPVLHPTENRYYGCIFSVKDEPSRIRDYVLEIK